MNRQEIDRQALRLQGEIADYRNGHVPPETADLLDRAYRLAYGAMETRLGDDVAAYLLEKARQRLQQATMPASGDIESTTPGSPTVYRLHSALVDARIAWLASPEAAVLLARTMANATGVPTTLSQDGTDTVYAPEAS